MRSAHPAVLAVAILFAFVAQAFATPAVNTVTPADGTVGTQLTIAGTDLGTAAPKAVLQLHGDATAKPFALKLAKPFDGTTLHATVAKIAPGVYDLVVTPKGGSAITLASAFTAHAPEVGSISTKTIAPGDHVDILGRYFGTLKGKVTIGGVTAKVTFWADGKITVTVSKKNGSGTATFDILGKGGTQTAGASATVVAPIAGKDNMVVTFNNGGAKLVATDPKITLASDNVTTYTLHGAIHAGTSLRQFDLPFVDKTVGVPHVGPLVVVYQGAISLAPFNYQSDGGNWTTTISQRVGNRITGTFSGGLTKTFGPGAASYQVTGTFTLTIQ